MRFMIRPRAAFCLVAVALALAGCGRRGVLEPPPGTAATDPSATAAANRLANATPGPTQGPQSSASLADTGSPGVLPPPNETPALASSSTPAATRPKKSFFLDPLL